MKGLGRMLHRLRQRRAIARLAGTRVLNALAEANPEAFFIQVGANDGRMMDPLRKTILATRWRGLALEPVPELYRRLRDNYRELRDRVRPVNVALAGRSGEQSFYHLQEGAAQAPLPAWARGLGSFRRDVILQHGHRIPDIENYLTELKVPCLSWADLCRDYAVRELDLVLTDTEGYDFEIIKQIPLDTQRPVVLIYEHHHFDADTDAACAALLHSHGYTLFREGLDTWAIDTTHADGRYQPLLDGYPDWVAASRYSTHLSPP